MRKAMAKLPQDRYGSASEMADTFQRAAAADGQWWTPERVEPLFDPLDAPIAEISGPNGTRRFDVREGPITIGRHEGCAYALSSPRLSRLHAVLYQHRGRVWLADLHSQNGTILQGRPMAPGIPAALSADAPMQVRLYDQDLTVSLHSG
jgi:serine/threonine-protein kinase